MIHRAVSLSSIRNTLVSFSLSIVLYKISNEVKNKNGYIVKFAAIMLILYALIANTYLNYNLYLESENDNLLKKHILMNILFFIFLGIVILFYVSV